MTDSGSPLTPEQQAQLQEGRRGLDSFMGAAKVAAFNGWSVGVFAGLSILMGLFSVEALIGGVGLAVVARNEFAGRTRLRALEPSGLELLWRNQLGFMALIALYCLWSMYRTVAHPDPEMAQLTELLGEGTGELVETLTLTVYGIVLGATVLFQGLNARYYFVRVTRLREYLDRTPRWIIDLQRGSAVD